MADHDGTEVTASEPEGSDAVTEAQRWLSQRGLPTPDAVPVRPGRATGPVRRSGPVDSSSSRPGSALDLSDPEELARGVVLRKLTGQARTRHELNQALRSKDVPELVASGVLDRMEETGLVDDAAFARDWVESRQQRRHLSRRALRHELQTKGVDPEQVTDALRAVDADDEYVAARALAERKVHALAGLPREVRYRRLAGVLARRGFDGGMVSRVLAEVLTPQEP